MNATKNATMISIFACMQKGNNHYVTISVRKVKELLKNYHKINVQRRWIFEVLRYLEENGYINRQRRYEKNTSWKIKQKPAMITFTLKGLKYLVSKKMKGAMKVFMKTLDWLQKGDKRWPAPKNVIGNVKPKSGKIDESYEEKRKRKAEDGYRPIDPAEVRQLLAMLKAKS